MMAGRLLGWLLRLQKTSNQIGQRAREIFTEYSQKTGPRRLGLKCAPPSIVLRPLASLVR